MSDMNEWEVFGQQSPEQLQREAQEEKRILEEGVNVRRETQENARLAALADSQKKVKDINRLLDRKTGKADMTEQEKVEQEKLSVLKDRQLSNVLLNEEKRKNESKDMLKFKDKLLAVEIAIGQKRKAGANGEMPVITGQELVNIEETYAGAIKAALDYVNERKKKAKTPKVMKANEALQRLMREQAMFSQIRMRINAGALSGDILKVEKAAELLVVARIYQRSARSVRRSEEEKKNSVRPKGTALRYSEMAVGEVKSLEKSFRPLFNLLTGKEDLAAAYKGVKWKKTNDALNLNRILAFVSRIKPDVFYSGSLLIDDQQVSISQDEDNRLTIMMQGQFFMIPGTTTDLIAKLTNTCIDNVRLLGTAGVSAALSSIDISDERTARITDVRTVHDLSVRVLEKLGGFNKPFFNNLPTTTIRTLAVHLMQGDMTREEVKNFVKAEEEKLNAQGLAREHNTAMIYFLMKSEEEQNEIIRLFSKKRKDTKGELIDSWAEVSKKALTEAGEQVTNRSLFAEIMRRVGHLDYVTKYALSSKDTQESYLKGFDSVRPDGQKPMEAAKAEFAKPVNRNMKMTNLALFQELMFQLNTDANRWEIDLQKTLLSTTFDTMQSVFTNVPDQMLDIFLMIERKGPITQEEIDHLNEVCKAGNFKEQMQTNMHDLELDLLVKRDEMEKKIRVTGLKSIEKKQQMETVKTAVEEKKKEILEETDFWKKGKLLLELNKQSQQMEEKGREEKKDLVQKLIADIVFSRDTGAESEGENAPGERMKRIIRAGIPAISNLIIEYSNEKTRMKKENPDSKDPVQIPLLKETLQRIPIGGETGFGDEFTDSMEEMLTRLIAGISEQKVNFMGQEQELSYIVSVRKIPYASLVTELEKALDAQFEENGAVFSMQFAEAEAKMNKSIDEATDMIQELFNEQQGIRIDAQGKLSVQEKEDEGKVNRRSNLPAIEREKRNLEFSMQMAKYQNDLLRVLNGGNMNEAKRILTEIPIFAELVYPIDDTKPVEEECSRIRDSLASFRGFLGMGGDPVYALTADYNVKTLPPEFYKGKIEEYSTITRSQALKGLNGATTDDSDRLLQSPPMKASAAAAKIIDRIRALADAKPEELQQKYEAMRNAWRDGLSDITSLKNSYLYTNTRETVRYLLTEKAFVLDENKKITGVKDRDALLQAVEEAESYLCGISKLYRDYETCQKAKTGDAEAMKKADAAESSFIDTFMQMNRQSAVGRFEMTLVALNNPNPLYMEITRKMLEPYFSDRANYGDELRRAYNDYMSGSQEYQNLENELYRLYDAEKREKAIREQNPDYLQKVARLKEIEADSVKAKQDLAWYFYKVTDNRLKIREWLAGGGEKEDDLFRKPQNVEEGRKMLEKMVANVAAGSEGTGKFVKLVMGQYFKKMSIQDKRAMIASVLREKRNTITVGGKQVFDPEEDLYAGFISGYLKGAGPLFQKMLQGLPESALPKEFRKALSDMKSNLAHIPEEVVQARLSALATESKDISRIEVVRSLGAASVGETFLCRIYGPKMKEGKEAVVKILRPEVKNRMDREKAFMLECAKNTDKGMELTYLGKLKNITEELDFTLEAKNIQNGSLYNKALDKKKKTDDVEAMKLSDLARPSSNVMLLEKAEGQTLNKYMDDTHAIHNSILEKNCKRDAFGKLIYRVDPLTGEERRLGGNDLINAEEERQKLVDRIAALKKRKEHLITLSKKWTYEGIFGEGFYHADLHSGNIQVSDEKVTVLDFGNCTKLTDAQQTGIIRMMVSVIAGYADTFRDEFLKLMTDTPKEIIEKNKAEFTRVIRHIFECGDNDDAALRIMAIISYASKLGFEIPRAVNDFADGALRLQNSVDSIDEAIRLLQEDVLAIGQTFQSQNVGDKDLDMVSMVSEQAGNWINAPRNNLIVKQMTLAGLDQDVFKERLDKLIANEIPQLEFETQYMQEAEDGLKQQFKNFCTVVSDQSKSAEEKAAARETFAESYVNAVKQRYGGDAAVTALQNRQQERLNKIFALDAETLAKYKRDKQKRGIDPQAEMYESTEKNLAGFFADEKYGAELKMSYNKLKQLHAEALANGNDGAVMQEEKNRFLVTLNKINVKNLARLLAIRKSNDLDSAKRAVGSFQAAMGETIRSKMMSVLWQMGIPKASAIVAGMAWDNIKEFFSFKKEPAQNNNNANNNNADDNEDDEDE